MAIPLVEGLTRIEGPIDKKRLQGTPFALPAGFPTDKYAAMWQQKGNAVAESQLPTYIESIGAQAEGWQVYKVLKNTKPILSDNATKEEIEAHKKWVPVWEPVERILKSGALVLMFRPLALQNALNQIYANQSREMTGGEIDGNSRPSDPGVLTNRDLREHFRNDREADEATGYLKPNPIARPTEAATLVV